MTAQDIASVAQLFNSYRIFYRQPSDYAGCLNFISSRFEQSDSTILVAVQDGDVVAFTQLYPLFSSVRMKPTLLLNDLYTHEDHRNTGIGAQLINFAKEMALEAGCAGLSLETEKHNAAGNHLYPQLGFELDTDHNFYFWTAH